MKKLLVCGVLATGSMFGLLGCFSSDSGSDTVVSDTTWTYARTLTLVLSDTAGASDTLSNYPVLVRLSNASDSAGANALAGGGASGSRLRFTTVDGAVLSHEIESWTSASASIWVRLPKVAAKGTTTFKILWGDSISGASSGTAVFDTSSGFAGVFHLNAVASDSSISEAAGRYRGLAAGTIAPTASSDAMAGGAVNFNGDSADINAGGAFKLVTQMGAATDSAFDYAGLTATFSVSAWVKVKAFPATNALRRGIVTKADSGNGTANTNLQWHLRTVNNSSGAFSVLRTSIDPSTGGNQVVRPDAAGQWSLVTYSAANGVGSLRVYNASGPATTATSVAVNGLHSHASVFIGGFAGSAGLGTQFFNGLIDEVRISNVARSDSWHNADYATQRPGSSAISLGATAATVQSIKTTAH